jgi:hypothetical protein
VRPVADLKEIGLNGGPTRERVHDGVDPISVWERVAECGSGSNIATGLLEIKLVHDARTPGSFLGI